MTGTIELTKDNFQRTISDNQIVFIDYWAEWCGPCKAFGPIYEQVAEKHPEIAFAKCDTEKQQELAASFQIRSIPTLMIFREETLIFAQPGLLPAEALEELVTKVKALDMDQVRRKLAAESEEEQGRQQSN